MRIAVVTLICLLLTGCQNYSVDEVKVDTANITQIESDLLTGDRLFQEKQFLKAKSSYYKALDEYQAKKGDYTHEVLDIELKIAACIINMRDFEEAENFLRTLEERETHTDLLQKLSLYNSFIILGYAREDYKTVIEYAEKKLNNYANPNGIDIINCLEMYAVLADANKKLENYEASINYHENILETILILKESPPDAFSHPLLKNYSFLEANACYQIADSYFLLDNNDLSEYYIKRAYIIAAEHEADEDTALLLYNSILPLLERMEVQIE